MPVSPFYRGMSPGASDRKPVGAHRSKVTLPLYPDNMVSKPAIGSVTLKRWVMIGGFVGNGAENQGGFRKYNNIN